MTSATRTLRIAAVTAGLTGALALTACSSGGGSGAQGDASPGPNASATSAQATSGAKTSSGTVQGSWLTTSDGKAVALVITGGRAGLFETGGSVCTGTAGQESGMQMINLTCTDGNDARKSGMVDSVTGDALKVTWSGKLGTETYTRAEGGKLPTGLPTANLGS